jgi:hypothetical protein
VVAITNSVNKNCFISFIVCVCVGGGGGGINEVLGNSIVGNNMTKDNQHEMQQFNSIIAYTGRPASPVTCSY